MPILHNSDCFSILPDLEDGSVDLVFADLPYGCLHVYWDEGAAFDLQSYWRHCKRLLRPGGAVVMTASLRFAVPVINAAPKNWFSYDLVWDRVRPTGFLDANRMPMKRHELILVFAPKRTKYNPQMTAGKPYTTNTSQPSKIYKNYTSVPTINTGTRYPTSILSIPTPTNRHHPTEKDREHLQ